MKPAEVLLIEDNAGDAVLIPQILADCQLPVKLHVARDGEQALLILADANRRLDLIILDLNIPKMSGIRMLEWYQPQDAPVVVFTSSRDETEIQNAVAFGAREYVRKPTDIQAFTDAICGMILKWAAPQQGKVSHATSLVQAGRTGLPAQRHLRRAAWPGIAGKTLRPLPGGVKKTGSTHACLRRHAVVRLPLTG